LARFGPYMTAARSGVRQTRDQSAGPPRIKLACAATGPVLLALWLSPQAATPAQPAEHPKTPPLCCVAPAPAQPAVPDTRGTAQQPLTVQVTQLPPAPAIERPIDWSGWVAAGAALLLVGVTGALAIFTYRLWKSTGALVTENTETAERELRAYVFVETAFTRNTARESVRPYVAFKNSGKTPAYKIRLVTSAGVAATPERLPPLPEAEGESYGHLAPGAPLLISVPPEAALTNAEMLAVTGNQAGLYARGRIRYVDAFKRPRFTEFCVVTRGEGAFENGKPMASCTTGNRTDDDI
jgi:hypothetical protein